MAFNILAANPHMIRYAVSSADGSVVSIPLGLPSDVTGSLLGNMLAGPLRSTMAKLTASWDNGETTFSAVNPMSNPRITTIVTPLTTGGATLAASVGIRYANVGGVNELQVLGGAEPGTTGATITNAIVEIRFNHSLE
jgi:hypothetical protein